MYATTTTSLRTGPIPCQLRIHQNKLNKASILNSTRTKGIEAGINVRVTKCFAFAPEGPDSFVAGNSTTTTKVGAGQLRSQISYGRNVVASASASAAAPSEDDSNSNDQLTSFLQIVGGAALILAILHFEDVVAGIQWSIYQLKLIGSLFAKACSSLPSSSDSMEALQSAIGSFIVGAWTGAIKTGSNWLLVEGGRVAGLIESVASSITAVVLSFWVHFTNQISGFSMGVEKAVLYVTGMVSFIPVIPALIAKVASAVTGILTWKPLALPAALTFTLTKVYTTWILSVMEAMCELLYITPFSIVVPVAALLVYFRKEWMVSVADVEKLIAEKMAKKTSQTGKATAVVEPPTVVEPKPSESQEASKTSDSIWNFEMVSNEGKPTTLPKSEVAAPMTPHLTEKDKSAAEKVAKGVWDFENVSEKSNSTSGISNLTTVSKAKTISSEAVNKMKSEIIQKQKAENSGVFNMEGLPTTPGGFRGKVSNYSAPTPKDNTTPQDVRKMEGEVAELWNFQSVKSDAQKAHDENVHEASKPSVDIWNYGEVVSTAKK